MIDTPNFNTLFQVIRDATIDAAIFWLKFFLHLFFATVKLLWINWWPYIILFVAVMIVTTFLKRIAKAHRYR